MLEIDIEGRIARRLEQTMEQLQVFAGCVVLVQVENQHAVVAHAGELVSGVARHQAGAHAADLTAATADLEFGATDQGHHQLMMVMGMFMGLFIQANHTGLQLSLIHI